MARTGGGGGCDLLGLVYCFVSIFVFGYIGWTNYQNLPGQIKQAKAWAHPQNGATWVEGKCKVHSTGISDQGACWHPAPMQDPNLLNWGKVNRDPSLPGTWSVCPGWHWCSDEGGDCYNCNGGEVLYATALFHGNVPFESHKGQGGAAWMSGGEIIGDEVRQILLNSKVPTSDKFIIRNGKGPVKCEHGDTMPFKVDPAPGQKKHCYCKPKAIVDVVKQKGPIHPHGQSCSNITNRAFLSETQPTHRRLREFVSPKALNWTTQKWMFPEGYCRAEATQNSLVNDFYYFNQEYRVYLNWALVEVSVTDSKKPVLRCAYEFGAPFASREDTDAIKNIYMKWKSAINQGPLQCYVRQGGGCGKSSCAVALTNPSKLYESPPGFEGWSPILFMILGCCPYIICFCVCCIAVVSPRVQTQNQQNQEARPLSQEQE